MPRKLLFLFCLIVAAIFMAPKPSQAQTYTESRLYGFCGSSSCSGSVAPNSTLIQAADGNFYGTTAKGGANSGGSVFKITPAGTFTTLYSFCSATNCTDGNDRLGSTTLLNGTAIVNASDFGYLAGAYIVNAAYSGDARNAASSTTLNLTVQ